MQKNDYYQVINTKVSMPAYRRLLSLMSKKALNWYKTIQMFVDICIRYMDGWHNLSEEMERMMYVFEMMIGWDKALTIADPTTKLIIGEATYYLFDESGDKKGVRAVHVTKPFFGNWKETFNVKDILERTLNYLVPARYLKLRQIAAELDCSSFLDFLDYIISDYSKHSDLQAIREEFEDADRSEWGIKPKTDGPYVRRHAKHIDESQQIITFNEDEPLDDSVY